MKRMMSFFLILIGLPSCWAPKYTVPRYPLPKQFEYQRDAGMGEPLVEWWKQFDDKQLNKLIDHALLKNYELRIVLEKIEESRELYKGKRADLFPEINVVSDVSRSRISKVLAQTSFLDQNRLSFFSLGFDASWELDVWGKLRHAKQAQFFLYQAQIENMRDVYIMLLADVARNYIIASALYLQIRLARDRIKADAELLCLQRVLFDAGLVSQIAVAQQEQSLADSQDLYKRLQTDRAQTENQLAVLLGDNPETVSMRYPLKVPLTDIRLETGIPSDLLKRRPDIRQLERELASANESIGQAVAEWFPSFSLIGGLASETSKGSDWFTGQSLTWTFGPSINWPLINFGRVKANIKSKESIKRQAALRYSKAIIYALKDVEDFLVQYFNALDQARYLKRRYKQSKLQESLIAAQYESGLSSKNDVLIAQKNRIDSHSSYAQAQQAVSVSLIGVYKALGGGW